MSFCFAVYNSGFKSVKIEEEGLVCGWIQVNGVEASSVEVSPPNCAPLRVSSALVKTLPHATYVSVNSAICVSSIGRLLARGIVGNGGGGGKRIAAERIQNCGRSEAGQSKQRRWKKNQAFVSEWESEKDWADKGYFGGRCRGKPGRLSSQGWWCCREWKLVGIQGGGAGTQWEWEAWRSCRGKGSRGCVGAEPCILGYLIEESIHQKGESSQNFNKSRQNIQNLFPGCKMQRAVKGSEKPKSRNPQRRTNSLSAVWVFLSTPLACSGRQEQNNLTSICYSNILPGFTNWQSAGMTGDPLALWPSTHISQKTSASIWVHWKSSDNWGWESSHMCWNSRIIFVLLCYLSEGPTDQWKNDEVSKVTGAGARRISNKTVPKAALRIMGGGVGKGFQHLISTHCRRNPLQVVGHNLSHLVGLSTYCTLMSFFCFFPLIMTCNFCHNLVRLNMFVWSMGHSAVSWMGLCQSSPERKQYRDHYQSYIRGQNRCDSSFVTFFLLDCERARYCLWIETTSVIVQIPSVSYDLRLPREGENERVPWIR
ncbi:hypothetical protein VP01_513g2 [Puccinia sorghi]|uniref:Uncharacterized protein n=1 Tax=Puccinia sorghi TaxID=27349 RepID=A0A0L6UN01_9BASI|nr:hypothetical protein VP01_513g2 [Puccinia sorghi]